VDLKKPLKFGSESVLYTIATIALQYSLAGGQGMVSSNTIISSLSHNTAPGTVHYFRYRYLFFIQVLQASDVTGEDTPTGAWGGVP